MYLIQYTNKMKRDVKRMKKRGKDISKLTEILSILASGDTLPVSMHDHQLTGNRTGFRECHIEPDWLLIYQIDAGELVLVATETGTHAELFNM